jgi:gas vesicle protein
MNKSTKIALGILGAAAVGVVIGGLFYTEKGKELRSTAKDKMSDWSDQLTQLFKKSKAEMEEASDKLVKKARELRKEANTYTS